MDFDELLITTGVDALVKMVKEKGKIELAIASQLLNIPQPTLEEWAHILEDEGIIRIEYKLTKIYLIWVLPTAEEIEETKAEIYKGKEEIRTEISSMDKQVAKELEEIEQLRAAFSELYAKLSPKFETFEKEVKTLDVLKEKREANYYKYSDRISEMNTRLLEISNSINTLTAEFNNIKKQLAGMDVTERLESVKNIKDELRSMSDELKSLQEKVEYLSPMISKGGAIDTTALKANFAALQSEFDIFRKESGRTIEDLRHFRESQDILASVEDSILDYSVKADEIKAELKDLDEKMKSIQKRAAFVSNMVSENIRSIDNFKESIHVAEEVLAKFPSQKELLAKLDSLEAKENEIERKLQAFSKEILSVPSTAGMNELVASYADIKKRIEKERKQLAEETEAILSSIEEQKATFSTYQKIREKVTASLEEYAEELDALHTEYERLYNEMKATAKSMDEEFMKSMRSVEEPKVAEVLKSFEELKEKKELLESIKNAIDTLSSAADKLSRRLKLLAKEAALLEVRAEGGVATTTGKTEETAPAAEKEEYVRNAATLTKKEQYDFEQKREELRRLIKKLWEES